MVEKVDSYSPFSKKRSLQITSSYCPNNMLFLSGSEKPNVGNIPLIANLVEHRYSNIIKEFAKVGT